VAAADIIAQLGGRERYDVASGREQRGGIRWCAIRLRAQSGLARCCSGCGRTTTAIHDADVRRVRDLPMFEVPVELVVPRLRVACPACRPKLERLSWLANCARVTVRLAPADPDCARECRFAKWPLS